MRKRIPRDLEPAQDLIEHPLSLDEAYGALQSSITSAVHWYLWKKASKRRWSRALRFLTIAAVVLGGLSPIVSGIWSGLPSVIGFILLGLAAGMQLLDRSFGFSEGWSRNLKAALTLEACGAKLALEYGRLKSKQAENDKVWQLLIAASDEAWRIIGSETSAWLSEFESAMEDIRSRVVARHSENSSGGTGSTDETVPAVMQVPASRNR